MKHVLVLAGPSAVGKTTVMDKILELDCRFEYVRSATTRPKRPDAFADEYVYLTKEEFQSAIERGEILEYMEYADNLYGTPASELLRIFGKGKIPLLILDLKGVESLREGNFDFSAVGIYIYDDINVMESRLYERSLKNTPTVDALTVFMKRKNQNIADYLSLTEKYRLFDAFVKNETVEAAALRIISCFDAARKGALSESEQNLAIAEELSRMAMTK